MKITKMKVKETTSWRECIKNKRYINKGKANGLTDQEYYFFRLVAWITDQGDYFFRIVAWIAAGQSEPGPPRDAIQARPRDLAPKILTSLNDVNVKAGNDYTISIEYIGSPDPNVDWYVDESSLMSDERTTASQYLLSPLSIL